MGVGRTVFNPKMRATYHAAERAHRNVRAGVFKKGPMGQTSRFQRAVTWVTFGFAAIVGGCGNRELVENALLTGVRNALNPPAVAPPPGNPPATPNPPAGPVDTRTRKLTFTELENGWGEHVDALRRVLDLSIEELRDLVNALDKNGPSGVQGYYQAIADTNWQEGASEHLKNGVLAIVEYFKEVFRDPANPQNPPGGGDDGTGFPVIPVVPGEQPGNPGEPIVPGAPVTPPTDGSVNPVPPPTTKMILEMKAILAAWRVSEPAEYLPDSERAFLMARVLESLAEVVRDWEVRQLMPASQKATILRINDLDPWIGAYLNSINAEFRAVHESQGATNQDISDAYDEIDQYLNRIRDALNQDPPDVATAAEILRQNWQGFISYANLVMDDSLIRGTDIGLSFANVRNIVFLPPPITSSPPPTTGGSGPPTNPR